MVTLEFAPKESEMDAQTWKQERTLKSWSEILFNPMKREVNIDTIAQMTNVTSGPISSTMMKTTPGDSSSPSIRLPLA
jgi:hypothetical protein